MGPPLPISHHGSAMSQWPKPIPVLLLSYLPYLDSIDLSVLLIPEEEPARSLLLLPPRP